MSKSGKVRRFFSQYSDRFICPKRELVPDVISVSQEFKEDCDINVIVRRFASSGEVPSTSRVPLEGDFSQIRSFDEAMNLVVKAQQSFDALPSKVRERFDNDPSKLISFMADSKNESEAVSLGLVAPIKLPDPAPKGGQQAAPAAGEGPKA